LFLGGGRGTGSLFAWFLGSFALDSFSGPLEIFWVFSAEFERMFLYACVLEYSKRTGEGGPGIFFFYSIF
jgi:hypothetical protein